MDNAQLALKLPEPNPNELWHFYNKDTGEAFLSHACFFGTRDGAERMAKQISKQHDIECEARIVDLFDL